MNYRMVFYILGILLGAEAALMLMPLAVALVLGEDTVLSFAAVIALLALCAAVLARKAPQNKRVYAREGFLIVSVGWVAVSVFGALPFFISREIPRFIDALFESVSGFTTTGASILSDVEALSRSTLFWRSFTHWIGGMGVLVFIMAVLPLAGSGNIHIMRAESPGPNVTKLVARTRRTALILYEIYIVLTLAEVVLLLSGGVAFLDSLMLSFGTAGTGGFGILNDSFASYSPYVQIVVTVFMILFGVNFGCYFLIITGNIRDALKNEEVRAYLAVIAAAVLLITVDIRPLFESFGETVRHAAFQVGSIITTTGFTSVDFNAWPEFSRALLLLIMCIGACAGSTGGGLKVSRVLVMCKQLKKEIRTMIHPNSVSVTLYEGKPLAHETVRGVNMFFAAYMIIICASVVVVALDGFDFITNFSAVIATLNNIGPGLEIVGATGNYGGFSVLSKSVLITDMLFGRLEIFPLLLMFIPATWRR